MHRSLIALPALFLLSAAPVKSLQQGRACVLDSVVASPVVREDGRLYFRGQPDRTRSFVAGFKGGRCPSLNSMSAVAVERLGNGYCEGDKVRAINLPVRMPGPICILDRPQPFSGDITTDERQDHRVGRIGDRFLIDAITPRSIVYRII